MPYTKKQMEFFRVAMHDPRRTEKERSEYRRMYNEGKKLPTKPAKRNTTKK